MSKNIAFLFGAGVSIPSKILKTEEITKLILESKKVVRSSAESYYIGNPKNNEWSVYADAPSRVQSFLNKLSQEIENYSKDKSTKISYEDIYNLLDFIIMNYHRPNKNPVLEYFLKEFEPKIKELLIPLDTRLEIEFDFSRLLDETNIYIKDLVTIVLSQKADNFTGLKFINEYINENISSHLNIFTLNHDTVIEQFFDRKNISFNDGFEKKDEDYQFWNPCLLDINGGISLYKIHGSVNWHYFDENSWKDRRICKVSHRVFWREPKRSILLIGTDNKLSAYIRGAFLELYYRFYKNLTSTDTLIVAGYSFSDEGINEKLFDWVLRENNKMIIIDPDVENLKYKMWSILFSEWDKNEKIIPIKEYSENITWDRIKEYLN